MTTPGYIFTFGLAHPLAGRYVALAGDAEATMKLMKRIFGGSYAGQYDVSRGIALVRRSGLVRLELGVTEEFDPVPPAPTHQEYQTS